MVDFSELCFKIPYVHQTSSFSSSGDKLKPVYTLKNVNGERSLVKVDELDIQTSINSFKDVTDLKAMLKRFSLSGDFSLLNRGGQNYIYGDTTTCETDLARLLESMRLSSQIKLQDLARSSSMSEETKVNSENGKVDVCDSAPEASDPVSLNSKNGNNGGVFNE